MFRSNLHIKLLKYLILFIFFGLVLNPIHLSAQNSEVVAQKGDGIYSLLTRNGYSYAENLAPFIELNKGRMGKDNALFVGTKYKLPAKESDAPKAETSTPVSANAKIVHYDIFGPKFADVDIQSNTLNGAIYYLVSGHGGPDPGAMGKYNGHTVCEDEYAYDVTLRLARNLIQEGASVYMITRDPDDGIRDESYLKIDHDEYCYPKQTIPLNQTKRLRQRSDAVNNLYAKNKGAFQRMIAIHVDSRSQGENIDVFFYHDKRSETGQKAATILKDTFSEKYREHQPGRGYGGTVSDRNLYVVKNTYPPAVYIELANMNHSRDIQRLIIPTNRQALANWLTEGLIRDFKTNK